MSKQRVIQLTVEQENKLRQAIAADENAHIIDNTTNSKPREYWMSEEEGKTLCELLSQIHAETASVAKEMKKTALKAKSKFVSIGFLRAQVCQNLGEPADRLRKERPLVWKEATNPGSTAEELQELLRVIRLCASGREISEVFERNLDPEVAARVEKVLEEEKALQH